MRVTDWNGTSNDAQVTVSIATSVDATGFDGDPDSLTWDGFELMDGASPALTWSLRLRRPGSKPETSRKPHPLSEPRAMLRKPESNVEGDS